MLVRTRSRHPGSGGAVSSADLASREFFTESEATRAPKSAPSLPRTYPEPTPNLPLIYPIRTKRLLYTMLSDGQLVAPEHSKYAPPTPTHLTEGEPPTPKNVKGTYLYVPDTCSVPARYLPNTCLVGAKRLLYTRSSDGQPGAPERGKYGLLAPALPPKASRSANWLPAMANPLPKRRKTA